MSPNVEVFNQDAGKHGSYLYTRNTRLSVRYATERTAKAILDTNCFPGRSVLDIGCGDGFFSNQFWDKGKPCRMVGVDAAQQAVMVASTNKDQRPIEFAVGDAHHLPWPENSFDIAMLQSILHHDDEPQDLIREAFRLAPEILIHEPNGNNLGLKIIEKVSPYYREHHEKSYTTQQFDRWIQMEGCKITYRRYAGFVPMFCSNGLAKVMKILEPVIETFPFVNAYTCSVVVIKAMRSGLVMP